MKKFLLLILLTSFSVSLNAQCDDTLPIMETFDSDVINVCWDLVDSDGDGWGWYWRDYGSVYGGYKCLVSRSWNSSQGDLNPDNWIYSYAIDLTSFSPGETIELSWKVRGELNTVAHEYYTVYAATGNQITDFESSTIQLGEYADEVGADGVFVTRNLDISALAGNTIYIAFRHQNISGSQFILNIDDVSISSSSSLSTEDTEFTSLKHYYNKNAKALTLKSASTFINTIDIYNVLGKKVYQQNINNYESIVDVNTLTNGIYIARVTSNDNKLSSFKFVKH